MNREPSIADRERTISRIALNIERIRYRVDEAARRCGRDPRDVTIIAASKYGSPDELAAALSGSVGVLGENRVQSLLLKAELLAQMGLRPEWHFIGTLQRNKVRKILPLVTLVHSLDSLALATEIDQRAAELGKVQRVLIEVNVSGEASKAGCMPDDASELLSRCVELDNIRVEGLMSMAADGGGEIARKSFRELRSLRDLLRELPGCRNNGLDLEVLSMGMSGDFEVAIEEGSSMVRIGSAIFE